MNNEEILKLAQRCNILGGKVLPPACDEGVTAYWVDECSVENLEAFYKAAFNAGIEAAAKHLDDTWYRTQTDCSDAIRKLELK